MNYRQKEVRQHRLELERNSLYVWLCAVGAIACMVFVAILLKSW